MLRVFYGGNRLAAEKCVQQYLGKDYEVFAGENLNTGDLPSVFRGTSLFETEKRRILIKDLAENAAAWEKLHEYADTEHEVICWELKIDKRGACYKKLKDLGVEIREFPELQKPETKLVFGIFETALRDGKKAVEMVEKIELEQDPYMFLGLLVTQALKRYEMTRGARRERVILKELAETDMQMKSAAIEPWGLVKSFLIRVSSL